MHWKWLKTFLETAEVPLCTVGRMRNKEKERYIFQFIIVTTAKGF